MFISILEKPETKPEYNHIIQSYKHQGYKIIDFDKWSVYLSNNVLIIKVCYPWN